MTSDKKKEYIIVGIFTWDDYVGIVCNKWQEKDNTFSLPYKSVEIQRLSGRLLAAKNNDVLTFYALNGKIQEPGTELKRKVYLESDEGKRLVQQFQQDKKKLFERKYIVFITLGTHTALLRSSQCLLDCSLNNAYNMSKESFSMSFEGKLTLGLLNLESSFPVQWNMSKDSAISLIPPITKEKIDAEIAYIFKRAGLTTKLNSNDTVYYDSLTQKTAWQWVYSKMGTESYEELLWTIKKYYPDRSGSWQVQVPPKNAEAVDGNQKIIIALVFEVTPDLVYDPIVQDSLFKCKNGELRILDNTKLTTLLSIKQK